MREILFRGKRKDNGEFVYGNPILMVPHPNGYDKDTAVIMPPTTYIAHGDIWGDFWWVDPQTIGEFVGLRDKHGRMIFEGDIVKYKYAYGSIDDPSEIASARTVTSITNVVTYKNGQYWPRPFCDICSDAWYSEGAFDFEVIGNIHDNPELLEEVEK